MDIVSVKRSDVGEKKFAEIAELGGFGAIGVDEGGLDPDSTLDLTGVLDPENKAVDEADKKKIRALIAKKVEIEKVDEKK